MEQNGMTLREVCRTCQVSRRAVQGYEKHGLVRPTGRSERGYLLYDAAAQQHIRQIKRYQEFGFQVKEIRELLQAPPSMLKEKLLARRQRLLESHQRLAETIQSITELIHTME